MINGLAGGCLFGDKMIKLRRDAGVVELDALEKRCALTGTVGSNPTLSATSKLIAILIEFLAIKCQKLSRSCIISPLPFYESPRETVKTTPNERNHIFIAVQADMMSLEGGGHGTASFTTTLLYPR